MSRTLRLALGLALLAGGIVLLVLGYDASDSLASEASKLVDDTPSDHSIRLLVGGGVCGVAGLALLLTGRAAS